MRIIIAVIFSAGQVEIGFDGMNDDITRTRKDMLGLIMDNRSIYDDAVDTIDGRANFFGTMGDETGAVWFREEEKLSREKLQGFWFDLGSVVDKLVLWREEAGKIIMSSGYEEFKYIYNNPDIDKDAWSAQRLKNEQNNPDLQKVHEKYLPEFKAPMKKIIEMEGNFMNIFKPVVKDILDPAERIRAGCKKMGMMEKCGE